VKKRRNSEILRDLEEEKGSLLMNEEKKKLKKMKNQGKKHELLNHGKSTKGKFKKFDRSKNLQNLKQIIKNQTKNQSSCWYRPHHSDKPIYKIFEEFDKKIYKIEKKKTKKNSHFYRGKQHAKSYKRFPTLKNIGDLIKHNFNKKSNSKSIPNLNNNINFSDQNNAYLSK
jgi:hypothetical protein